ncbi:MAG: triose-phosphate isomerase [Fastidiosipila sp.]|nr:triose-phosphate isomerase [Fastidiosipila sp.]
MKCFYFGTNTKMYMTAEETTVYVKQLVDLTADINRDEVELFVIPSFTAIKGAREAVPESLLTLGSQTVSWENEGQLTGEISPTMVKEAGASLTMVGHSERRHIFHENDKEENSRVLCALRNGLRVLLCIGETSFDKSMGVSDEVLAMQMKIGLNGVLSEDIGNVWLAYEPVWAIGVDGVPAEAEYVEERHKALKRVLKQLYPDMWCDIPLLYGGSVNLDNAIPYALNPSVDGLFVGRSAWHADNFSILIHKVLDALKDNSIY